MVALRVCPAFLFLLAAFAGVAADHYVTPPGGYGTNNPPYTNWADAATNIQWAVNVATNGETVWVTNGDYSLTNQIVITNQVLVRSLNGYGNTVILGNGANRCFFMTNRASISGLTITNGFAASNDYWGRGGGIMAYGTCGVYNCLITGNRSDTTNRYEGGGGMYINRSAVTGCIVRGNVSSLDAGGINAEYSCLISGCVIDANIASNRGGGMRVAANTVCAGNQIVSNKAYLYYPTDTYYGGGGALNSGGFVMFTNCVFDGNWTAYQGGGIYFMQSPGMVIDCVFSNNRAVSIAGSSGLGGALSLYGAASGCIVTALNCQIVNNYSAVGGGISVGAGGYALNCLFKGNRALNGGAVRMYGIQNYGGYIGSCTIVSNYGTNSSGAIYIEGTNNNNSVYNCAAWGNNSTNTAWPVFYDTVAPTNANALWYTCANYTNFPAGQGNITNDPQFVDFAGGNYRLNASSPCVNAGTNQSWMTNAFDLDGRMRIRYGIVDMGAYENIREGALYHVW